MDLLIGDVFRSAARAVPDRVAVAHGERALTFAEVDRRANQVARALRRAGLGRGDCLAAWAATDLDLVPVFAGAAKLGVAFAPVSGALTADEAAVVLAAAEPAAVVADVDRHRSVPSSIRCLDLRTVGDGEDAADLDAPGLTERDAHVVFFTSGSTGAPKGAVISHRASWLRTTPGPLPEPRGAMVCPFPLFHMAAWTIGLQQWQARDRVVFLDAADAGSIGAAVERHRATRLNCVPSVWRRVLDAGADLTSLRFADTGTSATPVELLDAIAAAAPNAQVRVFYGSTEAGGVACLEHADRRRKPGSCGVPAPGVEVRVDAGELWCRSPALFDGYRGDAADDAEVLVDGWYRTGDLADVDAEGYLTIVGRARDVIRSGGETVAPAEVETLLASHADVDDVAVVGIPDDSWGEIVCAVVVPRAGRPAPSVEELRRHCEDRLAAFKHPRRLEVVDRIPRTASTGQVQRRLLVERLMSRS